MWKNQNQSHNILQVYRITRIKNPSKKYICSVNIDNQFLSFSQKVWIVIFFCMIVKGQHKQVETLDFIIFFCWWKKRYCKCEFELSNIFWTKHIKSVWALILNRCSNLFSVAVNIRNTDFAPQPTLLDSMGSKFPFLFRSRLINL